MLQYLFGLAAWRRTSPSRWICHCRSTVMQCILPALYVDPQLQGVGARTALLFLCTARMEMPTTSLSTHRCLGLHCRPLVTQAFGPVKSKLEPSLEPQIWVSRYKVGQIVGKSKHSRILEVGQMLNKHGCTLGATIKYVNKVGQWVTRSHDIFLLFTFLRIACAQWKTQPRIWTSGRTVPMQGWPQPFFEVHTHLRIYIS